MERPDSHHDPHPAAGSAFALVRRSLRESARSSGDGTTPGAGELQILPKAVLRRLGVFDLPADFRLSVVIPVFNERATVEQVITRVREIDVPVELIIVDDGSRDGTSELLETYASDEYTTVVQHPVNRGKGAALKTGFLLARGDVVVVQDADLEYDPADLRLLIQPIVEGRADVVYGSRFAAPDTSVPKFWHSTGNRMITLLSNIATNLKLTDVETCYKVFRREVIAQIAPKLQETGFGIELELTALISKIPGVRVHERPISYSARSYAEGKKIGLKDAFRAVWCIVKY